MDLSSPLYYRVGPFMFDPARRYVEVGPKKSPIPEKLFEVLELLLEANGRVVERDAFFSRIWNDEYPSDANLTQHIFMLRKLLRDVGGDERYILTVPRKGYRFALPVQRKTGLMMKASCERCGVRLGPTADAVICSFECTYCNDCGTLLRGKCTNCGGKLERRPTREVDYQTL